MLSALQFRISSLYQRLGRPCFSSVELDHSDAGREGRAVSTLTEPVDWEEATKVAVQELRRRQVFGSGGGAPEKTIVNTRHVSFGTVPSIHNLDFVMESDALVHVDMDQRQGHEALLKLAEDIRLQEVNETASAMLSFAANYGCTDRGDLRCPVEGAEPPTWTTPVVACVPMSGEGCPGLTEETLAAALAAPSPDIEPVVDVEVPDHLLSEDDVAELVAERLAAFVTPGGSAFVTPGGSAANAAAADLAAAQVGDDNLRRLWNGISVNYALSANEPCGDTLRLVPTGGRCLEGAAAPGAVSVGTRALSETGSSGRLSSSS